MWSHRFGRPVCVLFLTECDMTFGKVIVPDHLGDYKGSINLSVTPGYPLSLSLSKIIGDGNSVGDFEIYYIF